MESIKNNGDRLREWGILEFMNIRKRTDQFVLNDSYWNILDLHIALVHVNPASDSMTNPDHSRIQMARHVDFWDEIDVARAKQTIKIVNVIFV